MNLADERAAYIDGYAHAMYDADLHEPTGEPWESCDEEVKDEYRGQARDLIELSRREWVEEVVGG